MSKIIEVKIECLIGDTSYSPGNRVEVLDNRAYAMVKAGHAVIVEDCSKHHAAKLEAVKEAAKILKATKPEKLNKAVKEGE